MFLISMVVIISDIVCRICVITLAKTHPVVSEGKKIAKIEYLVDVKVSHSSAYCLYGDLLVSVAVRLVFCQFSVGHF